MPNWVSSNIRIKGRPNVIQKLVNDLHTDNEQKFDFNAIIPRPKTLNITCGSNDTISMRYALSLKTDNEREEIEQKLKKIHVSFYGTYYGKIYNHNETYSQRLEEALSRFTTKSNNSFDMVDYEGLGIKTFEDLGNMYLHNILEYGSDSWYDWSINNWGTKWNARCTRRDFKKFSTEVYYDIDTAWSHPRPILVALVEKYDIEELEIWYCDEDAFGGNYGHYTLVKERDNEIFIREHDDTNMDVAKFIFGSWIVENYINEGDE